MRISHTKHWEYRKQQRPEITDDILEYAIIMGRPRRDTHWDDCLNTVVHIPHFGKKLKVVYKWKKANNIKIITAFWVSI